MIGKNIFIGGFLLSLLTVGTAFAGDFEQDRARLQQDTTKLQQDKQVMMQDKTQVDRDREALRRDQEERKRMMHQGQMGGENHPMNDAPVPATH